MEKLSAKDKIDQALLDFLDSGEFPDISVADIVEKSGVSKSTFYRHYKDIYDVYEQLVDGFIERCKSLINRIFFDKDITLQRAIWIIVKSGLSKDNELFRKSDLTIINYSIKKEDAQVINILYDKMHSLVVEIAKRVYDDDEAANFGATFVLYGNIIPIFYNLHTSGRLKLKTVFLTFEIFEKEVEKWKQQQP